MSLNCTLGNLRKIVCLNQILGNKYLKFRKEIFFRVKGLMSLKRVVGNLRKLICQNQILGNKYLNLHNGFLQFFLGSRDCLPLLL